MNPIPLEIARRLAIELYCSDAGASPETQAALEGMKDADFHVFKNYFMTVMGDYCPNRPKFIKELMRQRFSKCDRLVLFSGVGELEKVQAWLEMERPSSSTLWTATNAAARGGHYELVRYFKDKGEIDADQILLEAARCGNLRLVELALESGATTLVDAAANAADCGHLEILSYLLPRIPEPRLEYVLRVASASDYPEIVSFLLDQGAPVSQASLEHAAYNGRLTNLELLLPKRPAGLSLNSSLVKAAQTDQVEILQLLLEQGAQGLDLALDAATLTNSSRAGWLLRDHGAIERPLGFSGMEASDYATEDDDGF